jgi:DNA end-binding protein Ku
MELALDLVKKLSGPFDPSKHPDEYRAGVEAAVEAKVAEGDVARQEVPGEEGEAEATAAGGAKVIDLAELLSRSLGKTAPKGPKKAEPREETAAPARKTRKKAG